MSWISVEERHPRGPCLLLLENGEVRQIGELVRGEYIPYAPEAAPDSVRITHWRPLPIE